MRNMCDNCMACKITAKNSHGRESAILVASMPNSSNPSSKVHGKCYSRGKPGHHMRGCRSRRQSNKGNRPVKRYSLHQTDKHDDSECRNQLNSGNVSRSSGNNNNSYRRSNPRNRSSNRGTTAAAAEAMATTTTATSSTATLAPTTSTNIKAKLIVPLPIQLLRLNTIEQPWSTYFNNFSFTSDRYISTTKRHRVLLAFRFTSH